MLLQPVFIRSVESMTNFMTNQKVINSAACLFPHWQSQNTSVNVEAGGLHFLVLHHQVFGSKQLSKLGLDFVAVEHRSLAYGPIIQKKEVRRPPSGQFEKCLQTPFRSLKSGPTPTPGLYIGFPFLSFMPAAAFFAA